MDTKASFRDVLHYGKPYWKRYLGGIIAIFAVDALEVIPPAVVSMAINSLSGVSQTRGWLPALLEKTVGHTIPVLAWVLIVTALVQWILRYIWRFCFIFTREYVSQDLRRDFFRKLTTLPYSFYNKAQTGKLMSLAINDVDAVRGLLGQGTLMLADSIAYYIFVVALLWAWHPRLTLYLLVVLPIVPFFIHGLANTIHQRFSKVQEQLAVISAHGQEAFSGIAVIKGFVREEAEIAKFNHESRQFYDASLHLARAQALFAPLLIFVLGVECFIILWVGGHAVKHGELTPGELVGFFVAMGMLTWPTHAIGWVITMYRQGLASLGRIKAVFNEPSFTEKAKDADLVEQLSWSIEVKHLGFSYPEAGQPALSDVSFQIPAGKTLAILGPVGSGKSSLLRLLLKEDQPQHGQICIGGQPLELLPAFALRQKIGYLPQDPFLFSATIAENIGFALNKPDLDTISWAAQMAGIHDEIVSLPHGYQTILGEQGINLSGGQKQRIAIARTLAMRPRLLILDDCLSSVDSLTERKILTNLKAVAKTCTTIIITNRLAAISDSDHIVVLEDGQAIEQGTHAALMQLHGWYAHTYREQIVALLEE